MRRSKLIQNISSDYFNAAAVMHRTGRIMVYVEGYDDVSFWRGLLSEFETDGRRFEVSTPARGDLAKGKKVVLKFAGQTGKYLLLCVDSDFDYLFGDLNDQSRLVNGNPYVIQTYAYAIENLLCYPPSLHAISARATKNDAGVFDFVEFMAEYSQIVYPLFLWYAYAARINQPGLFPLIDFKNTVRINYLSLENNGEATLDWLTRQIDKKIRQLSAKHPQRETALGELDEEFKTKGVREDQTHLYMQGHTLMDNVIKIILADVCEELRKLAISKIMNSSREGLSLHNELSYYNNSLQDVNQVLKDNTFYRSCPVYSKIHQSLTAVLEAPDMTSPE